MKILHLTLKKKWFDMVSDPNPDTRKDEEYREIKSFWIVRLLCDFSWDINKHPIKINANKNVLNKGSYNPNTFDAVCFHHGYAKNHLTITREWKGIDIGPAKPEWSDNWQGDVFRIKLGEVIK